VVINIDKALMSQAEKLVHIELTAKELRNLEPTFFTADHPHRHDYTETHKLIAIVSTLLIIVQIL
jgi:hypothetical protein